MRIQLDSIPDDGLDVHADAATPWAVSAVEIALGAAPDALRFDLRVSRIDDHVRVRGEGETSAELACDRCGDPVRLTLSGPVDLYYAPESYLKGADSELGEDDLDIGWFDGEALQLADVLSEAVALWAPDRVRCGDRGVVQVGPRHACGLPPEATAGPDLRPPSPFAKLRLPE